MGAGGRGAWGQGRPLNYTSRGARCARIPSPLSSPACNPSYEALTQRCPGVPEYRLHWAQALCKAGRYGEAARTATSVEGQEQAVRQLQAAIQYEAGDLRGCRAALEVLGDAAADPAAAAAAAAAAGCVLYKEGRWAEAAQQFVAAAQAVRGGRADAAAAWPQAWPGSCLAALLPFSPRTLLVTRCLHPPAHPPSASPQGGYTPELAYSLAACQYRGGNLAGAAASLAQVVEAGVQQHPELGIGTQTEGMEVGGAGGCFVWGGVGAASCRWAGHPLLAPTWMPAAHRSPAACRRAAWATAASSRPLRLWRRSTCGQRWSCKRAAPRVGSCACVPPPEPFGP